MVMVWVVIFNYMIVVVFQPDPGVDEVGSRVERMIDTSLLYYTYEGRTRHYPITGTHADWYLNVVHRYQKIPGIETKNKYTCRG